MGEAVLDTLSLPVCENICAPRSRLAPARQYHGHIPSKRSYFHGLKPHLVCTDNQWISEAILIPDSVSSAPDGGAAPPWRGGRPKLSA